MDFAEFLKGQIANKKFATVRDLYEFYEGEKRLGLSLRGFQQIASGERPPSEKLIASMFQKLKPSEKKTAVVAFFRSTFSKEKAGGDLINYIDSHLSPEIESESKSIWETDQRSQMMLSEEQLDFLTNNSAALRLHQRVTLFDFCFKQEVSIQPQILNKMIDLHIIRVQGDKILPSREIFRIPTYENSGPKLTAKGTELILKFADTFVSKEGSPNQNISLQMHLVSPRAAEQILAQMQSLRRWIQSLSTEADKPDTSAVPFFFMSIAKRLDRREF